MAGGQGITSGQGSVTPSESKALSGSAVTSSPGTLSADLGPTLQALTGEGSTASTGTTVGSRILSLRSRKVGGGSASRALVGIAMTNTQGSMSRGNQITPTSILVSGSLGAFTKSSTRPISGISATLITGTFAIPGEFTVPDIFFVSGSFDSHNIRQYVPTQFSGMSLFVDGALPNGVTFDSTLGSEQLVYDGTTGSAVVSGLKIIVVPE